MKRILIFAVLLVFTAGLMAGCGNGVDRGAAGDAAAGQRYKDGSFTAVSANANMRSYVEVTLTLASDKITDVAIVEYDGWGGFKDYEGYGVEGVFDGSKLKAAHEALAAAIVEQNSPEVDVVSGATSTSQKTMDAVKNALAAAKR